MNIIFLFPLNENVDINNNTTIELVGSSFNWTTKNSRSHTWTCMGGIFQQTKQQCLNGSSFLSRTAFLKNDIEHQDISKYLYCEDRSKNKILAIIFLFISEIYRWKGVYMKCIWNSHFPEVLFNETQLVTISRNRTPWESYEIK